MNIQLTIITILVVVSAVSLVINFGLWSDTRAQVDIIAELRKDVWHYYKEADSATDMYLENLAHLRGAEHEIMWLKHELAMAKSEVKHMEALLSAIESASEITHSVWSLDAQHSQPPF